MNFLFDDRCSVSGDLSEDGLSSNEEDGDSSDSSKEDMSHSKDKEVLHLYTDTQKPHHSKMVGHFWHAIKGMFQVQHKFSCSDNICDCFFHYHRK